MVAVSTSSLGWAAPVRTNEGSPVAAAAPPAAIVTTPALRLTVIPAPGSTASVSSSESTMSSSTSRATAGVISPTVLSSNIASMRVRSTLFSRTTPRPGAGTESATARSSPRTSAGVAGPVAPSVSMACSRRSLVMSRTRR